MGDALLRDKIFILRPAGGIIADVVVADRIVRLVADDVVVVGRLPQFTARFAIGESFECGDHAGGSMP